MKRLQCFLLIIAFNVLPASFGGATLVSERNPYYIANKLKDDLGQIPIQFAYCNIPDPTSTTLDVFYTRIKDSSRALPLLRGLDRRVQNIFPMLSELRKYSQIHHNERVHATMIALAPGIQILSMWRGALRRSVAYEKLKDCLENYVRCGWKFRCEQLARMASIERGRRFHLSQLSESMDYSYTSIRELHKTTLNTLLDLNASQFKHPRLPDGFEAQIRTMCDELQHALDLFKNE